MNKKVNTKKSNSIIRSLIKFLNLLFLITTKKKLIMKKQKTKNKKQKRSKIFMSQTKPQKLRSSCKQKIKMFEKKNKKQEKYKQKEKMNNNCCQNKQPNSAQNLYLLIDYKCHSYDQEKKKA